MVRVSYCLGAILVAAVAALLVNYTKSHLALSVTSQGPPEDGNINLSSPESASTGADEREPRVPAEPGTTEDDAEFGDSDGMAAESTDSQNQTTTNPQIEEDILRNTRDSAVRETREAYALLLAELELTPQEEEDLLALFVEVRMSNTWVHQFSNPGPVRLGTPISDSERSDRIAAVIGRDKLQRFLVLESDLSEYRQTYRIAANFERRGVPLTKGQSDGLFNILVETGDQASEMKSPPGVEPGSREFIEFTLAWLSERERNVIALAASVLSPEQVIYLDEIYQRCTYERNYHLQRQPNQRDNLSGGELPFTWMPCGP